MKSGDEYICICGTRLSPQHSLESCPVCGQVGPLLRREDAPPLRNSFWDFSERAEKLKNSAETCMCGQCGRWAPIEQWGKPCSFCEPGKTGQVYLEAKCLQLEVRIKELEAALEAAYELNTQLAREMEDAG